MGNITELNDLIWAVAKLFSDKIGIFLRNSNKQKNLDEKWDLSNIWINYKDRQKLQKKNTQKNKKE